MCIDMCMDMCIGMVVHMRPDPRGFFSEPISGTVWAYSWNSFLNLPSHIPRTCVCTHVCTHACAHVFTHAMPTHSPTHMSVQMSTHTPAHIFNLISTQPRRASIQKRDISFLFFLKVANQNIVRTDPLKTKRVRRTRARL